LITSVIPMEQMENMEKISNDKIQMTKLWLWHLDFDIHLSFELCHLFILCLKPDEL
jgi:hypothetical protein